MDWTAPQVLELHDRELKAQKELILSEIRRLDEELETQVARFQEQRNAGRVEYDGRIAAQSKLIDTLALERQRAQEKFEATVAARFVQQNEFRQSLDDLSKSMATRRELEASIEGIKAETTTALTAANAKGDESARQLQDLRSRLDVGAPSGQSLGYQQRSQQVSAAAIAWAGVAILAISVAVSLIVKFS